MASQLWKLPLPSSARLSDDATQKGGRLCVVTCVFDSDPLDGFELCFDGTEAYTVSYHRAAHPHTSFAAYDQLVDCGSTPWLCEITQRLTREGTDVTSLRHLAIYFDDGPLYEFLCRSVSVRSLDPSHGASPLFSDPR